MLDVKFDQLFAAERRVRGTVQFAEIHVVELVGETVSALADYLVEYRLFGFAQGDSCVFKRAHRRTVAAESHYYGVCELFVRADIVVFAGLVEITFALCQRKFLVAGGDFSRARVDIHQFPEIVALALKRELLPVAEIMYRVQAFHVDYGRGNRLFIYGRIDRFVCRFHNEYSIT